MLCDPDRPDWHDHNGALVATCRWGYRPTGKVTTLLARQDWLTARLDHLGYDLITGLFGEIQTTKEIPRTWRQFSQTASHTSGVVAAAPPLTQLRHNPRQD